MQSKLYVGNLTYQVSENDLQSLFSKYGAVKTVNIIRDSYSGQSKGFAFVEMSSPEEAQKALAQNGTEFMGQNIRVSEARPQTQTGRSPRSGGFNRTRGDFGGGGGRRRY